MCVSGEIRRRALRLENHPEPKAGMAWHSRFTIRDSFVITHDLPLALLPKGASRQVTSVNRMLLIYTLSCCAPSVLEFRKHSLHRQPLRGALVSMGRI